MTKKVKVKIEARGIAEITIVNDNGTFTATRVEVSGFEVEIDVAEGTTSLPVSGNILGLVPTNVNLSFDTVPVQLELDVEDVKKSIINTRRCTGCSTTTDDLRWFVETDAGGSTDHLLCPTCYPIYDQRQFASEHFIK
jgi:hypothetical protein